MNAEQRNAYLTSIEPGDAMSAMFKRYWLPMARGAEIEAGGDPKPVRVLGEDYIVWRDAQGRIGVLSEHCLHRRASLALGNVEPDGIRCIYHGWKFAADGTVLDMPNVSDCRHLDRFRQPSFPSHEAGGVIWAYLGPRGSVPAPPEFEFMTARHVRIEPVFFPGNFVQVMEGFLDSSHLGFLHADIHSRGVRDASGAKPLVGSIANQFVGARAPRIEIEGTEWGFRYAALRAMEVEGEDRVQARVTAFFLPSCALTSADNVMEFAVPIDTQNTIVWMFFWSHDEAAGRGKVDKLADQLGLVPERRYQYGRTGAPMRAERYGQDRAAMREGRSFSGLPSVLDEDIAVINSMGTVTDRSRETLVESDLPIVAYRRALVANARAIEAGEPPRGLDCRTRPSSGEASLRPGERWQSMFDDGMDASAVA